MLTLKSRTAAAALLLAGLLSACGQGGEDPTATEVSAPTEPAPVAPDPGVVVDPAAAAPEPVAVAPPTPGVWTSGTLTIRADTANLRVTQENFRHMGLGLTVTFENASDQPVSVILAEDGRPGVQLDNGLNMTPVRRGGTGILNQCSQDLVQCRNAARESFLEVEPGKTLSVTMTFGGEFAEGGRPELQTVETATLTMRVHALDGDGLTRTLDVSLKDTPIRNRIN
jgi:hypothetical protein